MKKKIIPYFIIMVLATFSCKQPQMLGKLKVYEDSTEMIEAAKKIITEIGIDDFKQILDDSSLIVIDIRSEDERESGYIPGSVYINRGVLELRIDDEDTWNDVDKKVPDKSDLIILYCGGGSRSALATKSLMQLGYVNVKSLQGGWADWHEAYPEIIEE